jgi:hypothetical protein
MTPIEVRVGDVVISAGDPQSRGHGAMISGGFHLAEPLLSEQVNARYKAGEPFTADEGEWLLQTAVVSIAGAVVEQDFGGEGASADWDAFTTAAALLGKTTQQGDYVVVEPSFVEAAWELARTIFNERISDVQWLADILVEHAPAVIDRDSLGVVFESFGSPQGSHRHLLPALLDA